MSARSVRWCSYVAAGAVAAFVLPACAIGGVMLALKLEAGSEPVFILVVGCSIVAAWSAFCSSFNWFVERWSNEERPPNLDRWQPWRIRRHRINTLD